jgi:hypothetical protein
LRRNVGHQRAIALGLTWIRCHLSCSFLVVMDGDGEDDPNDVPTLLRRCEELAAKKAVFARRTRRTEGLIFRGFYRLYRFFFRTLTGRTIRVGNFSVVPAHLLERLVCVPELWNHYAAAFSKARVPFDQVPTPRGSRLAGQSRMNLVSLMIHGLSAISVFGEEVGLRLLLASLLLSIFAGIAICAVVFIRFFTDLAIPGWATSAFGLLLVLLVQGLLSSLVIVFLILQARSNMAFLPLRDYGFYILECKRVVPRGS